MPVVGANIVAKNITTYGGRFLKTVNGAMKEVQFLLDKQLTKNISRTDFSLKELAAHNHSAVLFGGPALAQYIFRPERVTCRSSIEV